jgi:pyruvate carboxylase subunit B
MAKKFIDVMDTTFRDGFQSVYGGRVLMKDFLPAVDSFVNAGIRHFECGGGARFQSLYFYCNEDAFTMMDKFREIVGSNVNLQTLARGISYVGLDSGSRDVINLHSKLFKKHGITTIRNFDALNDVQNLEYSAKTIVDNGLNHEVCITVMELPPECYGAHEVDFYEKVLRNILDSGLPFNSLCFKDASGTARPRKIYDAISMARRLLPKDTHIRFHTHETAGISVACYLAALEAGVDGIDLAMEPVSGGTSQPDILVMMHAIKGSNFEFGFEYHKLLEAQKVLKDCLKDYFVPPEAKEVSTLIQFSPMPGGALTANTQMMRDTKTFDKLPAVLEAMGDVVKLGGFGTSVTPVSQFYFQQAFNNVVFGPWKKIADGYGKMVLGYFGKTPVEPDNMVVKLAKEQLSHNSLDINDENIFIVASCGDKGISFLKGDAKINVRKVEHQETKIIDNKDNDECSSFDVYSVKANSNSYKVCIKNEEIANQLLPHWYSKNFDYRLETKAKQDKRSDESV